MVAQAACLVLEGSNQHRRDYYYHQVGHHYYFQDYNQW